MGQVVLYLGISVDGYLADKHGGVDWLSGDGSEPDAPGSYPVFLDTVWLCFIMVLKPTFMIPEMMSKWLL